MAILPDILSGGFTAVKLHWMAKPSHIGIGMRLLLRAEVWAKKNGATDFYISAINNSGEALLARLKLERMEVVYRKAL